MKNLKILSFVPINIIEVDEISHFNAIHRLLEYGNNSQLISKPPNAPVYAPKTFKKIKVFDDATLYSYKNFLIYFNDAGKFVGGINYRIIQNSPVINAVAIIKKYRGKGLGLVLYNYLLKQYGKIISDGELSIKSFNFYLNFYKKNKLEAVYVDSIKKKIIPMQIKQLSFNKQVYVLKGEEITVLKNKPEFEDFRYRLMILK